MHLKPPTAYFLDVLVSCRCLSAEALQVVRDFNKSGGSMKNFEKLFSCEELRHKCQEFYESKHFLRRILSSKMEMAGKIAMIKKL